MEQNRSNLIYEHKKSRDTFLYKSLIGFAILSSSIAVALVFKFGALSDAVPVIIGCFIMLTLVASFCWEYLSNATDIKFYESYIELDGQRLSWSAVKKIEQTLLVHFIRISIQINPNDPPTKIVITNRFTNKELFILPHHTNLTNFLIDTWKGKTAN